MTLTSQLISARPSPIRLSFFGVRGVGAVSEYESPLRRVKSQVFSQEALCFRLCMALSHPRIYTSAPVNASV